MVAINNFNKFYITDATNNTMPHRHTNMGKNWQDCYIQH